jgi:hypothetical protein
MIYVTIQWEHRRLKHLSPPLSFFKTLSLGEEEKWPNTFPNRQHTLIVEEVQLSWVTLLPETLKPDTKTK